MSRAVTLALAGDVMLGRLVNEALQRFGPSHPWGNTAPLLRAADRTIVNLECVIASGGRPWSHWPKVFHFRADPIAIEALLLAGVDAVVLANNHVLDFDEEALLEMLDLLERHEIAHAGAGRDLEEARRPALLEANGLRLGLVAFTDNEPGWAAEPDRPGVSWIQIGTEEQSLGPVREGIERARGAGAETILFSVHWGPNMVERPSARFRDFARAVIDAGADVFHGHSAHLFQGIEIYRERPIIYDAGDFVDDYAVDPDLRNDLGLLFRLELEGQRVRSIDLTPVAIGKCQVNLAEDAEREAIVERIRSLSAEMGTLVRQDGERVWVEVSG